MQNIASNIICKETTDDKLKTRARYGNSLKLPDTL